MHDIAQFPNCDIVPFDLTYIEFKKNELKKLPILSAKMLTSLKK